MMNFHLLLVDDEERFLTTTQTIMNKRGIDVSIATNGLEALKVLEEKRIDVVVLDIKMPGMDGIEVLKKIKKKYPLLEIILLTGHGTVETAVEGLKMGAFEYLLKPCSIETLLQKVEEALVRKRGKEQEKQKDKIDKIISSPLAVFEED